MATFVKMRISMLDDPNDHGCVIWFYYGFLYGRDLRFRFIDFELF